VDELYACLSLGYDQVLDTTIRAKYYVKFSQTDNLDKTIDYARQFLPLEKIIDAYDHCYKKEDHWDEQFKQDIMHMIIHRPEVLVN
jgi:hypothetical protein